MSTYQDIKNFGTINNTDQNKVNKLVQSILSNGWEGDPILYCNIGLITGSHRLTALHQINKQYPDHDILFEDIAEDITEQVNQYCEDNDCIYDEIDFRFISQNLGYKDEGWD